MRARAQRTTALARSRGIDRQRVNTLRICQHRCAHRVTINHHRHRAARFRRPTHHKCRIVVVRVTSRRRNTHHRCRRARVQRIGDAIAFADIPRHIHLTHLHRVLTLNRIRLTRAPRLTIQAVLDRRTLCGCHAQTHSLRDQIARRPRAARRIRRQCHCRRPRCRQSHIHAR